MFFLKTARYIAGGLYGQLEDQLRAIKRRVEERPLDQLVPSRVRRVSGRLPTKESRDECVVVALVRDGEPWLPTLLDHHLALGARHVILLDNGSVDRTVEIARRYRDVSVFRCLLPYRRFSRPMKRWLVRTAGKLGWVLLVDVDELFDYPGSDVVPLPQLVRALNERRMTAVSALMLDMLPTSLAEEERAERNAAAAGAEASLVERHAMFDLSDVRRVRYPAKRWRNELVDPDLPHFRGGVRQRFFGLDGVKLIKHPLLLPSAGVELETSHIVSGARVADLVGLLRHYKFAGRFREQVSEAVVERQYYRASREYRAYARRLRTDPVVDLVGPCAEPFTSAWHLAERGVLPMAAWYRQLVVDSRARAPSLDDEEDLRSVS